MNNEDFDDVKNVSTNKVAPVDTAKFISSEEDEKEGNFEFLCCRGGSTTGMGGVGGGRW